MSDRPIRTPSSEAASGAPIDAIRDAASDPAREVEGGLEPADRPLRFGFSTGACAAAAAKAAHCALMTGSWPDPVGIRLPKAPLEMRAPRFALVDCARGPGWARATVEKDAGDDPDVTHGALVTATVRFGPRGAGVRFFAGEGVGRITKPGLPLPVGEPAINPAPRRMIIDALRDTLLDPAAALDRDVEIAVPGGAALALKTWNPRLGIEGGLSILGTTGVVRPFSCAAWIASIHRGVDVARANGAAHVVGATGATSEATAKAVFGLPDWALLDMGDFAGGLLKYLRRRPVPRVTIAGGVGKMTKLAQGALDLHSKRSQVDFAQLAESVARLGGDPGVVRGCNTAAEAHARVGPGLSAWVARAARDRAAAAIGSDAVAVGALVVDRAGRVVGRADPVASGSA